MKKMKFGASSSILILDFDPIYQKFRVVKTIEVPRSEYTYDNAVNKIVELNALYNPSWIFVDAGAGEYQIERLHIIGENNPETGLKHKVRRWQFKQGLDVTDPITGEIEKKPLKQFMVSQLQILFERSNIILSPFDEVLYDQLINYEVVKRTVNNEPIFTSENEHFIDALGLAYLAFVLEFPDLTNIIKRIKIDTSILGVKNEALKIKIDSILNNSPLKNNYYKNILNKDDDDSPDKAKYVKTSLYTSSLKGSRGIWGARRFSGSNSFGRKLW